jgi:hypothetical protein
MGNATHVSQNMEGTGKEKRPFIFEVDDFQFALLYTWIGPQ